MMGGREFDFAQGLKPNDYGSRSGTTEEDAEKRGKADPTRAEARQG